MKAYQPVACGFLDRIEDAIVRRQEGLIRYMENGVEEAVHDRLVDWKAENGVEYVFTASCKRIRMDELTEVFGHQNEGACEIPAP